MARRSDSVPGSGNAVPPCDTPDDDAPRCRHYVRCQRHVQTCTAYRHYVRHNDYDEQRRGHDFRPVHDLAAEPEADADADANAGED